MLAKWIYTFVLLFVTIAWAWFTVYTVGNAAVNPDAGNIIEASGTSVLLGALISMNVNVNTHWFRKKTPDDTET